MRDTQTFYRKYRDALAHLKNLQCGEAIGALWHPEIGYIDLIWGEYDLHNPDKGWGLKKIIEKHPEVVENLDKIIRELPIVATLERLGKIELDNGKYHATIKTHFDNSPKKWLLTAFEINLFEKGGDGENGERIPKPPTQANPISTRDNLVAPIEP